MLPVDYKRCRRGKINVMKESQAQLVSAQLLRSLSCSQVPFQAPLETWGGGGVGGWLMFLIPDVL